MMVAFSVELTSKMSLSCMVGVRLYATKYLPGRESKGGTSHICYSTSQVSATARHRYLLRHVTHGLRNIAGICYSTSRMLLRSHFGAVGAGEILFRRISW